MWCDLQHTQAAHATQKIKFFVHVVVVVLVEQQQVLEILAGWSGASVLQIQTHSAINSSLHDALDLSPEMKHLSLYNGNLCWKPVM